MNVVYLLLGSNLDDRSVMLDKARKEISSKLGRITLESSIYESEPWGFLADHPFLNQVIRIETVYDPSFILSEILKIEIKLGRVREGDQRYNSRLIDIDILFFNDEIITEENLTIPHPGIPDRMFTLLPMQELAGSFIHPGSLKSIREMIHECSDPLNVYLYQP